MAAENNGLIAVTIKPPVGSTLLVLAGRRFYYGAVWGKHKHLYVADGTQPHTYTHCMYVSQTCAACMEGLLPVWMPDWHCVLKNRADKHEVNLLPEFHYLPSCRASSSL